MESTPSPTEDLLHRARRELLDLSTRNRLLAVPVGSRLARLVHVTDERSAEVYRLLVTEDRALSFLPGRSAPIDPIDPIPPIDPIAPDDASDPSVPPDTALPPAEDPVDPATGLPRRHLDARLQTHLSAEGLQRRLLDLYRDALGTIEETGVNVLYLALGQVKWFEPAAPGIPRHAPLVLVPVRLDRRSASERFLLRARDEDVEENLSLRTKLATDFGVHLPPFPDPETLDLTAYFAAVTQAITGEARWEIIPDAIVLGCFSFAKLLMYRDLDPATWPPERPLFAHGLVAALLADGFPAGAPLIPEDTHLDSIISADRLDHVVDADGSQTLAIENVRQGRSLVLQGPPGTGKSQSIANLIATAVLDGRRVLFVAEKLAALEVVQRRLQRAGLGDLCLELHSHKAGKRGVLAEIARTWRLGRPRESEGIDRIAELEARRSTLNAHCARLHARHPATGLNPFQVLGEWVRLGSRAPSANTLELPAAATWSGTDRRAREELVADLAARIPRLGIPAAHPWRGARRETVLALDLPRIQSLVLDATTRLDACRSQLATLTPLLPSSPVPESLAAATLLVREARWAASAPPLDPASLSAAVWDTDLPLIQDLVEAGSRLATARQRLGTQVTDAAWEKDHEPARSALAAHGRSLFRFLNADHRRALADLRGAASGPIPDGFEERLALADTLVAGQRARRSLLAAVSLGAAAFGSAWKGERSDWTQLGRILEWLALLPGPDRPADVRRRFAAIPDPAALASPAGNLDQEIAATTAALDRLVEEIQLDIPAAFGPEALRSNTVPFPALADRMAAWRRDPDSLSLWTQYAVRANQGRDLGLGPLIDGLHSGDLPALEACDAFQRAFLGGVLREMSRLDPALARFDGDTHDRSVEEFRQLDRDRLDLARHRVLTAHHARLPGAGAGVGAVGILNSELERKRGHRPVRQLLRDAGSVVQAIKPVFMMSPMSVAQFLAPGAVEFDLLVIDEASQVQPVDALGAIARCRQIVVVGDSRQLPPTRFFARVTGSDDEPDTGAGAARMQDMESILGLCSARGLPSALLRWHYRSRHHSLIAVSNREFYENRLFVVPSPYSAGSELGLRFHHLPDGVFDSGGSGTNRIEARTVTRAVLDHARLHPDLSLGVAAFSVRQQQAILDELELLRREHPETEPFFNAHPNEPFFVKNLETVQGDERDVVLISIGYGRDPDGVLRLNFGPLGAEGGERRLNVLITRARRRCVVFSSLQAADIDLSRATGRGVAALRTFLQFAETGRLDPVAPGARPDSSSPFEDAVRAALEAQGYQVHPKVGIAGFFVDLGVIHPDQPGRYLAGIECDGSTYHASRSARDRDRLRQAVLEDHGWTLLRIWSTAWFQRPEEQLRRTVAALEIARAASPAPTTTTATTATTPVGVPVAEPIEREDPADASAAPSNSLTAEPYVPATFTPPPGTDPVSLPATDLADLLLRVVEQEGPVHEDELVFRIRDFWNLPRAGARLQDAVARGVRNLLVSRRCLREEDCLDLPDRRVRIRNRESATSPSLRKPDLLPASEIRAAILALIQAGHGARRSELPAAVARLLGFRSTPPTLRARVDAQVAKLEADSHLTEHNDLLQATEISP